MATKNARRRVLEVDDDPAINNLVCGKLTREGFTCRGLSSGEEAVEALQSESFDIIISDLMMPGISGLEVLKAVRKLHPLSAFVMVTGVDDIRVGINAMKQGADDYLVKPFQLDAMVACVKKALDKKALELEVERYRESLEEMVAQRTEELQAALQRVEWTYDETLEALGAALDLRDTETEGHSRRVSLYSLEMGRIYGCTPDQLTHIARGSYLHDIGKIGIPDAILLKPGKLTPEERVVMETHVRIGYELVCRIAFLAEASDIVLAHQERFDGAGYPQALAGDDIPLGARIFAVADTLDAMTSDRPYRRALSAEAAQAEIIRESGHQFDPEVVRVFLSIPATTWEGIRKEAANFRAKKCGSVKQIGLSLQNAANDCAPMNGFVATRERNAA